MVFRIFIVEDDPWFAKLIVHHLSMNPDYELSLFGQASDALKELHKNPDLILMDFILPDMDGEQLFKQIRQWRPNVPVIVISAQEKIEVVVRLFKQGASDYIVKGEHFAEFVWKSVIQQLEKAEMTREIEGLREELGHKYDFQRAIVGMSEAVQSTFHLVEKAIQSTINVALFGETGTGKEVYAKTIHYSGPRKSAPFIPINMSAIPRDLAESELFGFEKGAFTGAVSQRKGKLEEANGGTLFLDEIAEMDVHLQSKLLRALQEREIVRVGGTEPIPVDFRLITATHRDLSACVAEGRFREDLYFRIMGLTIVLPPLRHRNNDVLILAKHFAEQYAKVNKTKKYRFTESAKAKLKKHDYPGNVRELKACVELACVMCENYIINSADISFVSSPKSLDAWESRKTLREIEKEVIQTALKRHNGNVLRVAQELDIAKSKIYQYMKQGIILKEKR